MINELKKIKADLETAYYEHSNNGIVDVLEKLDKLINKPVETTNEQPKYKLEWVNINATDNPARLTNLSTNEIREYGVEGLAWNLLNENQEVMHYVFTNFKSDIKIG